MSGKIVPHVERDDEMRCSHLADWRQEMQQNRDEQVADEDSGHSSGYGQQRAFAEQETQYVSSRSSQCQTHGDVIRVGRIARQDYGAKIGAQQHLENERGRPEQNPASSVAVTQDRAAPFLALQLNAEAQIIGKIIARYLPFGWNPIHPVLRDGLLPDGKRGTLRRDAGAPRLQTAHDG